MKFASSRARLGCEPFDAQPQAPAPKPHSDGRKSAGACGWALNDSFVGSCVFLAFVACRIATPVAADDEAGRAFFRARIEPVLRSECYGCHSNAAAELEGGLRLDSRAAVLAGGDGGAVVLPERPAESPLLLALQHRDGRAMPPKKPKLRDTVIADFRRWIELGVPHVQEAALSTEEANRLAARQHWAFQPVVRPPQPAVRDRGWVRTPVDAFVLARLEDRGWKPAPPADRTTWIRRVTFDLTGLPPTPEEVADYLADSSLDADERLVDRLLASPRYGERWGQHWLDVVRFAESEGYEYDRHVPDAWRFRDYVIASFDRDKPFDRFLHEQLAGDEFAPDDPECLAASIFHRLGPVRRNAGNPDIALSRNEVLTERTDIVGTAFLGLSIGCARCHNHKLEPISQKDYYRLQAYFAATVEHNLVLATEPQRLAWQQQTDAVNAALKHLREQFAKADVAERSRLEREIEAQEDRLPPPLPTIPSTRNDAPQRTAIHVLRRGVWELKGERVAPRPLGVLTPDDEPELPADAPRPRTELARWLTQPQHPLTARVVVNRVWQQHFGSGLVKTANDFGTHGERPSHPELLDWLAATFVESGWRWKPLHRTIVLSQTYRQAGSVGSVGTVGSATEPATADPDNRLLWRFSRRRLSGEEVRDAMLAVSGRLNARRGGPSVLVPVDPELVRLLYKPSQWSVTEDEREHDRRSIYLIAKRNLRLPFLENLDAPALLTSCPRREASTHAPQALELLNGELSNELARAFGRRLEQETGPDRDATIDRAFRLAFGRAPTPAERTAAAEFLRDQPLSELALALFNINAFVYVP